MSPFIPGDTMPWLEVTNVSMQGIWLLVDNEEFFLPYEDYSWFSDAPVRAIFNVGRVSKEHFRWPDLDVDLELDSLRHAEKNPLIARQ